MAQQQKPEINRASPTGPSLPPVKQIPKPREQPDFVPPKVIETPKSTPPVEPIVKHEGLMIFAFAEGSPLYKVVWGCGNMDLAMLAHAIRDGRLTTIEQVYAKAQELKYGCGSCLRVYGARGRMGEAEPESPDEARRKFADDQFNPLLVAHKHPPVSMNLTTEVERVRFLAGAKR